MCIKIFLTLFSPHLVLSVSFLLMKRNPLTGESSRDDPYIMKVAAAYANAALELKNARTNSLGDRAILSQPFALSF